MPSRKIIVEYHNIVCFGALAKLAGKCLEKGLLILVEGKLHYRQYTTEQKEKKTITQVVMEKFIFVMRKKEIAEEKEQKRKKGGNNAKAISAET